MRKLVAVAVMAAVLVGCAPNIPLYERIQNMFATVEKVLCSPTTAQIANAVEAIAFIQGNPIVAGAVGGAIEVFKNIRDQICVSIPQLKEALARFDAGVKALTAAKVKVKAPDLSDLRIAAEE